MLAAIRNISFTGRQQVLNSNENPKISSLKLSEHITCDQVSFKGSVEDTKLVKEGMDRIARLVSSLAEQASKQMSPYRFELEAENGEKGMLSFDMEAIPLRFRMPQEDGSALVIDTGLSPFNWLHVKHYEKLEDGNYVKREELLMQQPYTKDFSYTFDRTQNAKKPINLKVFLANAEEGLKSYVDGKVSLIKRTNDINLPS